METLATTEITLILFGVIMGTAARVITVRIDSRQVPSYPNGYFVNLVGGFIAASLGAVAIPALLARDFAAFTFLALAVQHFRDIRQQEQESLDHLEHTGFANRGQAYIDGIAKTYEARNYISLLTALGTVLALKLLASDSLPLNAAVALLSGALFIYVQIRLTKGKRLGDIADIREGACHIRQGALYVDDIYISNMLGTERSQQLLREQGLAFVLTPKSAKNRLTLENDGQRQAILAEMIRVCGVKRHQFSRRSLSDGRVALVVTPLQADKEAIIAAIRTTPILESVRLVKKGAKRG